MMSEMLITSPTVSDRTCFQCGSVNQGNKPFCADCSSPLELSAYISSRFKTELKEAIRDRDILETESASRVFERVWGWFWKIGIGLGAILLFAGIHFDKLSEQVNGRANDFLHAVDEARTNLGVAERLLPKVQALTNELTVKNQQVDDQIKRTSTLNNFVGSVLSSRVLLVFHLDADIYHRVITLKPTPTVPRTMMYVLLPTVPLPNSLQIQFGHISVLPDDIFHWRNVAFFYWDDPMAEASRSLYVSYYPDPEDKNVVKALTIVDGKAEADGKALPSGIQRGQVQYP